ncbi:hypothetical protein ACIU1J_17210 [Azospirillum doebereinerae]|uniref:hypothetical protein n=1 Tax=Azospirillum doebereinerae TaxID=92933 RepID=UPI001EE55A6F|nr:hypothetical protein [Azospirillum doebereinerae]MCG5241677.1 hypothetical protein [Azospirillum doebereinerae]
MADRDTTDTGRTGSQDTVAGMKQSVKQAADAALDAGRDGVDSAQGRIRSLLEQQTDRAADQLGGVASALQKAADQLQAENNGTAAQYAVQAADRVERVADMLRHSSLDDIVGEVEGFARRQPELFIGGAFALGFLAARFVKSSGERRLHGQTTGTLHSRTAADTANRHARRTSDYQSAKGDVGRFPSGTEAGRSMAGGIADSALRSPRRTSDLTDTATNTPKPATVGMPLSRAPASVTGHSPAPSGASTSTTALGSSIVTGPTGSGTTVTGSGPTAIKPQGQRP